ncbi:MAG TPA: hypothetical protein VLM40_01650 [Gemmata sp.]|nr:hypothetical protein [Gemmata sp.]
MPRFRFVAVDSTGAVHDGSINAATETDARNKLASNGLAVRTVEEVAGTAGDAATVQPPRLAVTRAAAPGPIPTRFADTASPAPGPRGSALPLVLSIAALLIAIATAGYVVFRDSDSPGGRMRKYNLKSAEDAYRSALQMLARGDSLAFMEYENTRLMKGAKDKLATLTVDRQREHDGKIALFIKYERKGKTQRQVQWMERDPDSGIWRRSIEMQFRSSANQSLPHELREEIDDWVTPSDRTGDPFGDIDP